MTAIDWDVTETDICLSGDEPCDVAASCTECDKRVCPEHTDDFTTCVDGGLHCGDCRLDCRACLGAMEDDNYEDRFERSWRGED